MIGAKTLATAALLTAALTAALAYGVLAPERLASRGWGTLFLVGLFAVVVGTLVYRFWRLGEPSRHYLRWATEATTWTSTDEAHFVGGDRRRITLGDNRGEAFDFGPRLHHAVAIAIALVVALACIDVRALGLLDRFSRTLNARASSYCPDPDAPPPSTVDPNAPGCELIRRAYALGYSKSLGECAPREVHAAPSAICTRRQRDEPLFHYAWRLLSRAWQSFGKHTEAGYFKSARRDFDERVGRLGSLTRAERQVLASAPHASHHIWTNLPDPGNGAFRDQSCADRYRWLAHRPTPKGDKQASQVFEHVLAQLMFESRYEPSAASCREVHVHWGAPLDTCARLAAGPEAVLSASSARSDVDSVLVRHRSQRELPPATPPRPPLADPARFVSFQCYFETGAAAAPVTKTAAFTYGGERFSVDEVAVAPSPAGAALYVDRYDAVARMLVRGFHYGALLSEAGVDVGPTAGLQSAFSGRDFLLTRVHGLDSVDLYLDAGWLGQRPDLLEVYPYQRHLKNYVQIFRRQYRRERGRL